MCDTCNNCECGLSNVRSLESCYGKLVSLPAESEKAIMDWAAEHPEPVYPTWVEYLVGIGVIPHEIRLETADTLMDTHLLKPIPADIAQKLGIEPKEAI
jgi:hypothetical protein